MALPSVGQAQLLAELFAQAIATHRPRSLALLGCAGGNGLEVVPPGVERVVAIDLHPGYVARARARFASRVAGLETIAGDVETERFTFAPVDLVFAGLLFEYVDVAPTLANVRTMLRPGGLLVAVLQLPSAGEAVTPSPYTSLRALAPVLRLVPLALFGERAAEAGFRHLGERTARTTGGKELHVVELRAAGPRPDAAGEPRGERPGRRA